MSLYVVQHKHTDSTCPARNREMGPMLLTYLSGESAGEYGVKINSEAVVDGAHTLYLIVEAADKGQVEKFMEPFTRVGSVEILPASVCEVVVERGSC